MLVSVPVGLEPLPVPRLVDGVSRLQVPRPFLMQLNAVPARLLVPSPAAQLPLLVLVPNSLVRPPMTPAVMTVRALLVLRITAHPLELLASMPPCSLLTPESIRLTSATVLSPTFLRTARNIVAPLLLGKTVCRPSRHRARVAPARLALVPNRAAILLGARLQTRRNCRVVLVGTFTSLVAVRNRPVNLVRPVPILLVSVLDLITSPNRLRLEPFRPLNVDRVL